ncbi:MAG: replicative DNA helicase [Acidobacteriota bacterium]|nr:replicative DNA helicase [Acidobacteriota bacterium]
MVQSIDTALSRRRPGGGDRPAVPAGTRLPPHNLDAEKSLLGAMLLSRDAIAAAMETCTSEDFYKPAHAHVFDAINVLYNQGEPADPVTVADELARAGLLDSVGGLAALVALQADTPATTNAARYARIVEEHALLRRLIAVAGEIAEMGYTVPDDVAAALDRAESLVFNVAERRVTDSLKPLTELLYASMDRLEQLFDRGESITGVPTGYIDLDERLYGLQPSTLVIVGARPAVGKCQAFDTRIVDPDTGGVATVEELFRRQQVRPRPVAVLSLDGDGSLGRREVSHLVDDGIKPVFRVRTRLGRSVRTTASHPFLTPQGWRPLADLAVGSIIGVPRVIRTGSAGPMEPAELCLLAHLLGAGADSSVAPTFRGPPPAVRAELAELAPTFGCRLVADRPRRWTGGAARADSYRLVADRGAVHTLADLLRRHGLADVAVDERGVPERIFTLPPEQIGMFLNRLFASGGRAWCEYSGDGRGRVSFATRSRQLARDVQHLLLRFGVVARLTFRSTEGTARRLPGWELDLVGRSDVVRFCTRIGIFAQAAAVARTLDLALTRRSLGWTPDTLAVGVWEPVLAAQGARPWASVGQPPVAQPPAVGAPLPAGARAAAVVAPLAAGARAALLVDVLDRATPGGESDVYWDEVVAITADGEAQVYDLTVPVTRNYVADDVLVHNTAFALGMASHAAVEARVPTLVFSLEMGCDEITNRLLVSEARVDAGRMRNGRLTEPDWPKISNAVARLGDAPLFIDDNPNTTVMEIRAKARRLKARHGGLGLIIVDYLQLMSGGSAENRQLEVSSISRGLKILARELEVPVVALSQLSRQLEGRADKRPTLADLRESGSLEQDADVVMFLYRDEIYNPDTADRGVAEVILAKHRNGPTGKVQLSFLEQYTKFVNMARV